MDEGVLRAAMLSDPIDEAPWLIYADWLEDQGDARASLFRERFWTNSLGIRFALVPRGAYWMSKDDKNAQRQVEIPYDFFLGIYPVTQGEWQALMGNNPSRFSRAGLGKDQVKSISDADLGDFPVECVSWTDVNDFIDRLNKKEPSAEWLYRLPTEAEWEYSCRGGVTSKQDCSFDYYLTSGPTNTLSPADANFGGNLGRTSKVDLYKPNRLGIYDLHGNVWEWTQDLEGSLRVIRGGSWDGDASLCAAAYRNWFDPSYRFISLGFRLARVPRSSSPGN